MSDRDLELLQFPTPYPIKVVCRQREGLRPMIDAIVHRHTPDLTDANIQVRGSSTGHFVSITYTLTARSAEHVTDLLRELLAHEAVVMVI
jgi:uncharacterized protein